MKKRLLNCYASDFIKMNKEELKNAIKASEGRTVLSENVAFRPSVASELTSSEIAKSFGADLILLNGVDLFDIDIHGISKDNKEPIKYLKKLVGRPIGVNLEPVDENANMLESNIKISNGRKATKETFIKANELGFDFICLTGNPGTGVTNSKIKESIKIAKNNFDGLIIAGKMHGAGVDEDVLDIEASKEFLNFGADIILVPAIGTIQGVTLNKLEKLVSEIHRNGGLVMSAIGTSQESSTRETIREIALLNKMAGVDIQHIGDAGYGGLAPYENIMELSIAIRGVRHTIYMISSSIMR